MDSTLLTGGNTRQTRKKRSKETKLPLLHKPDDPSGTVLVVEPDILARVAISEYLRDCGYKVIEADSIEDAFKFLKSDAKLDIVLVEVSHLGATEGFSLAKQIRESYPGVDVILSSSVADCADRAADLCDAGMLGKPYHPEELLRRIQVLRERRRSSKLP